MNIFKTALGIAAVAAIVPFKAKITRDSEGENETKNVTVESLVYRVEITGKRDETGAPVDGNNVNVIFPADGIKKIGAFLKEKAICLKAKIDEAREQRCATGDEDDIPGEQITIEVTAEDVAPETTEAPKPKAKTTKKAPAAN